MTLREFFQLLNEYPWTAILLLFIAIDCILIDGAVKTVRVLLGRSKERNKDKAEI